MKLPSLTKWMAAGAITLGSLVFGGQGSYSQSAPGQTGFWCDTSSSPPATLYQNSEGGTEPWIEWTSTDFEDSGYDPLTRCQQVSGRLETYRRNRQLRYITTGVVNRQNVICTASGDGGPCEGLIYTLKPGQEPNQTLERLMGWRVGEAGISSLQESTSQKPRKFYRNGRLYIDVGYINRSQSNPVRSNQRKLRDL